MHVSCLNRVQDDGKIVWIPYHPRTYALNHDLHRKRETASNYKEKFNRHGKAKETLPTIFLTWMHSGIIQLFTNYWKCNERAKQATTLSPTLCHRQPFPVAIVSFESEIKNQTKAERLLLWRIFKRVLLNQQNKNGYARWLRNNCRCKGERREILSHQMACNRHILRGIVPELIFSRSIARMHIAWFICAYMAFFFRVALLEHSKSYVSYFGSVSAIMPQQFYASTLSEKTDTQIDFQLTWPEQGQGFLLADLFMLKINSEWCYRLDWICFTCLSLSISKCNYALQTNYNRRSKLTGIMVSVNEQVRLWLIYQTEIGGVCEMRLKFDSTQAKKSIKTMY